MNGIQANGTATNGHAVHPTSRKDELDPRDQGSDMLDMVLENLSSAVRSAIQYMEGPLKNTVQKRLHNEDKLPDAKFSSQAANAIDLLHRAQLILEPRSTILADHFLGYVNSKCLNAAVERGIPDVLATGPMTLEKLSEASESRPDRLGQVLRVLYNNGIFEFDESTGLYRNNGASSLLRSDHWTQWRNWVELYGNQFYDVARGIPESTRKDATRWAAQINYDTDLNMFEYFQKHGWVELLHRTLGGGAEAMAPGIVEDYPWSELVEGKNGAVIIDIGGGGGGLIATLLRRFKNLHGAILDLPGVVEHARTLFHDKNGKYADVGDRVSPEDLIGGDFFASVPRFEIYTMKWCLHDWKDEKALKILGNIRRAIIAGPKSRLIVMETVIENGRARRLSRYGDIHMMMTANGFERTERQWRELAQRSGWEVKAIYNIRNAWVKAIELVPASNGYVFGPDALEIQRLTSQHEFIKSSMGNQIHCPINFKKESMRILDVGTADGHWLADIALQLPGSTTFMGIDNVVNLVPAPMASNITFGTQSVTEPWPKEWERSFDLVHQRLVLTACDTASAKRAVDALFGMVKPGGWIQLLECDYSGAFNATLKARYPATARLGELVQDTLTVTGRSGQHGSALRGWLREAGAVDIIETLLDCPLGARATTTALKQSTKENMLSVVQNLKRSRNGTSKLGLEPGYFDQLHNQLSEELSTRGSTQRFHLVYGRRPRMN